MSGLRLLADDLTGALDSAVAFCGARGPIKVLLRGQADAGDAALDLGCRDGSEAAAVAATLAAMPFLAGADLAYLKIDSLLRGHWAAMLGALWRTGAFGSCILAPAFPAQGRFTRDGRQYARDLHDVARPVAVDVARALAACGATATVCDAQTEDDLRAIASRTGLPGPVLWCGSAGLATALAGVAAPRTAELAAPILVLIGSCHPVSDGQVRHLHEATGRPALALRGLPDDAERVGECLEDHGFCVASVEIAAGTAPDLAAQRIAACLGRLLERLRPPGALAVVGGETLRAVCQAIGVTRLDVEAEFASGIPLSLLRGGAWDGIPVISKSGAFGQADALTRLVSVRDRR